MKEALTPAQPIVSVEDFYGQQHPDALQAQAEASARQAHIETVTSFANQIPFEAPDQFGRDARAQAKQEKIEATQAEKDKIAAFTKSMGDKMPFELSDQFGLDAKAKAEQEKADRIEAFKNDLASKLPETGSSFKAKAGTTIKAKSATQETPPAQQPGPKATEPKAGDAEVVDGVLVEDEKENASKDTGSSAEPKLFDTDGINGLAIEDDQVPEFGFDGSLRQRAKAAGTPEDVPDEPPAPLVITQDDPEVVDEPLDDPSEAPTDEMDVPNIHQAANPNWTKARTLEEASHGPFPRHEGTISDPRIIKFAPDKNGRSVYGAEISKDGEDVDWADPDMAGVPIMVTVENNGIKTRYLLNGNKNEIENLTETAWSGRRQTRQLSGEDLLKDLIIGQPWEMDDSTKSKGKVTSVMGFFVPYEDTREELEESGYELGGTNPVAALLDLQRDYQASFSPPKLGRFDRAAGKLKNVKRPEISLPNTKFPNMPNINVDAGKERVANGVARARRLGQQVLSMVRRNQEQANQSGTLEAKVARALGSAPTRRKFETYIQPLSERASLLQPGDPRIAGIYREINAAENYFNENGREEQ